MDYKEIDFMSRTWHRFSQIVIANPLDATPSVICAEDEVTALPGVNQVVNVGQLTFNFDQTVVFPLINPLTNEPIDGATATGAQVYALIYSYVMSEAAKRDALDALVG